MSEITESLPLLQDMFWKCDRSLLASTIMAHLPRPSRKVYLKVTQAIDEMCTMKAPDAGKVIVVPRERFTSPLFGTFSREITVECLDGCSESVIRSGIVGQPWHVVLSYAFWQGAEITYYDVHDALSLVVLGMLTTGLTAQDAMANAVYETEKGTKPCTPSNCGFAAAPIFELFGSDHSFTATRDDIARLEQEIVLSKRLCEINVEADRRFIQDVESLQAHLNTAA